MSEGLIEQIALVGGQILLQSALKDKPQQTQQLWNAVYGIAAPIAGQIAYALPHSRIQETEADHLGLIFMSMAGYQPAEAVTFWQRMASKAGGSKPPALLATHPTDQVRINNISAWQNEAMKYYAKAPRRY